MTSLVPSLTQLKEDKIRASTSGQVGSSYISLDGNETSSKTTGKLENSMANKSGDAAIHMAGYSYAPMPAMGSVFLTNMVSTCKL